MPVFPRGFARDPLRGQRTGAILAQIGAGLAPEDQGLPSAIAGITQGRLASDILQRRRAGQEAGTLGLTPQQAFQVEEFSERSLARRQALAEAKEKEERTRQTALDLIEARKPDTAGQIADAQNQATRDVSAFSGEEFLGTQEGLSQVNQRTLDILNARGLTEAAGIFQKSAGIEEDPAPLRFDPETGTFGGVPQPTPAPTPAPEEPSLIEPTITSLRETGQQIFGEALGRGIRGGLGEFRQPPILSEEELRQIQTEVPQVSPLQRRTQEDIFQPPSAIPFQQEQIRLKRFGQGGGLRSRTR